MHLKGSRVCPVGSTVTEEGVTTCVHLRPLHKHNNDAGMSRSVRHSMVIAIFSAPACDSKAA